MTIAKERGASSWLSARPVEEHGFALHKAAFRDAIALRYGWDHWICRPIALVERRFLQVTRCLAPMEGS